MSGLGTIYTLTANRLLSTLLPPNDQFCRLTSFLLCTATFHIWVATGNSRLNHLVSLLPYLLMPSWHIFQCSFVAWCTWQWVFRYRFSSYESDRSGKVTRVKIFTPFVYSWLSKTASIWRCPFYCWETFLSLSQVALRGIFSSWQMHESHP